MIVDFRMVRLWTKKLADAVNKAQQMHPDDVLTIVDSSTRHFGGLTNRRIYKKNVKSWLVYKSEVERRLTVLLYNADGHPLPANWIMPIYEGWSGHITDVDKVVTAFW